MLTLKMAVSIVNFLPIEVFFALESENIVVSKVLEEE